MSEAPREALPGFRRRIGVVFQDFRLIRHLSAYDNVALPLRIAGRDEAEVDASVREMLDWVGLADRSAPGHLRFQEASNSASPSLAR